MAGRGDYGQGIREDGTSCLIWPLHLFKYHFNGFGSADVEDWKAVLYKWLDLKPSFVEKVDIDFKDGNVRILYWLKPGVTSNYDETGRVIWQKIIQDSNIASS